MNTISAKHEAMRLQILSDESAYCAAVNWMGAQAKAESNHTYIEDGKVWHKNATELIEDGYLDKYITAQITAKTN